MQWTFPIQFGTPPQTLSIPIGTTSNLLWVVSEFCMNDLGTACSNRTTNFFNTSLSNTISGAYENFTIEYIKGSKLEGIWANDTVIINNQAFEQMAIGLPKDIDGAQIVPDTTIGQIGLMPYQNYILNSFAKQIVGISLSMNSEGAGLGGTITFGGIDSGFIIGGNENNIVYQHLSQPTDPNQQLTLDDNSAREIVNQLPGGSFFNGIAIVDCNISDTFDLSFEVANQKWRLPSSAISKDKVSGTNKCESIITGGANNGSWIFGIFDQTNSQFGIASRSDINYGIAPSTPTPSAPATSAPPGSVGIMIQVPGNDAKCLQIKSTKMGSKAFSLSNNTDSDGFYHVDKNAYPAITDGLYTFYFSPYSLNGSDCPVADDGNIATTPQLKANTTTDPWKITIRAYSVSVKVHIPGGVTTNFVEIDRVNDIGFAFYTPYFYIDKVDSEG
ncbi:27715_t:CDS:2, partial [Dentiscutata erythropus]